MDRLKLTAEELRAIESRTFELARSTRNRTAPRDFNDLKTKRLERDVRVVHRDDEGPTAA